MTNQLQGEILFKGIDASAGEYVYTPWMPVRGDVGTFGVQVLAVSGVTLSWSVETRTIENPATVALFANLTTVVDRFKTSSISDPVKQLVRDRFGSKYVEFHRDPGAYALLAGESVIGRLGGLWNE